MPAIERLRLDHAVALLAFERENRAYFAASVSDLVDLVDVAAGAAELGFRIAEKAAGRGLATAAVREVCGLARSAYRLTSVRAAAAVDNAGSRAVLGRTGFVPTGEEVLLAGRPGLHYVRTLQRSAKTGDSTDVADGSARHPG